MIARVHPGEIGPFKNGQAIKYAEAGSTKEEKDVLIKGLLLYPLVPSLKTINDSKQTVPKTAIIYIVETI